jgi:tripartite-type tricarboxylate transporter receptor subunit TctC
MQMRRSLVLSAVAAGLALTLPLGSAPAQAYPAKQTSLMAKASLDGYTLPCTPDTLAPRVPALAEAGFNDSEAGAWQGLVGPKGVSPDTVRVLKGPMGEILEMADGVTSVTSLALLPMGGEPAALSRAVSSDFNRYGKIIKEAGIQAD